LLVLLAQAFRGSQYPASDASGLQTGLGSFHNNITFKLSQGLEHDDQKSGVEELYLPWFAQGGILVYPHIRGGGENGVDWYEAGKKATKSNSCQDIIFSPKYLIDKGLAYTDDIVLMSPSGGGVAGGMAVNEAPELFKGFICEMPILNPSRLDHGNFSNNYQLEFGSVENPSEAENLYAMDPLLYLNLEQRLPNVLVISAGNDDRVDGLSTYPFTN